MRFTIRDGTDPVARADGTLLKALGLPAGGVVAVGRSAVLVRAGTVADPSGLEMGPTARANAGVTLNQSVHDLFLRGHHGRPGGILHPS